MPQNDTIYLADSVSCKLIPFRYFTPKQDSVSPVSAIWSSSTLVASHPSADKSGTDIENNIVSGVVFVYFVALIFFIRYVTGVFQPLIKSYFRFSEISRIEEKASLTLNRNILAWLSVFFVAILITAVSGRELKNLYGIFIPYIILIILGGITGYWVLRKIVFSFTSWLTKDKVTFKEIEKISYNYFILGAILTFIILILKFALGSIDSLGVIRSVLYIFVFSYILYVLRIFQVMKNHRFSFVFYILYLCAVEILPLSILTNIILAL